MKYQSLFDTVAVTEYGEVLAVVEVEEVKMSGDSAIQTFLNKSNEDATDKGEVEESKGELSAESSGKEEKDAFEGGEAEEVKAEPTTLAVYPSPLWFAKWKESLNLPNLKVCI